MENLDVIRDNGDDVPSVTSSSNLSTSSEFDDVGPTLAIIGTVVFLSMEYNFLKVHLFTSERFIL